MLNYYSGQLKRALCQFLDVPIPLLEASYHADKNLLFELISKYAAKVRFFF